MTLTGTLKDMGAMYGPIMPVIKASGTNAMTMVMVDISSADLISIMAARILSFTSPLFLAR